MPQLNLQFRTWGGKRKGAGRTRSSSAQGSSLNGERAGVAHRRRPRLRRLPVHVTWRMRAGVWNLRSRRCFIALQRAFYGGAEKFGFRLIHFSIQGNHIHGLIEAEDEKALFRGMTGLGVRIARALNRVMGRTGKVFAHRYHAHVLKTPTEVRRAQSYLQNNARHHYGWRGPDPYTSTTPVTTPTTFFLRRFLLAATGSSASPEP
jgi:REP element-mobilizing transposase RayT